MTMKPGYGPPTSTWQQWDDDLAAIAFQYFLDTRVGDREIHIVGEIVAFNPAISASPGDAPTMSSSAFCGAAERGQPQVAVIALRRWPSLFERPDVHLCMTCLREYTRRGGA